VGCPAQRHEDDRMTNKPRGNPPIDAAAVAQAQAALAKIAGN
jgi:hypothetical protein